MNRVLVTGNNGSLGKFIVDKLRNRYCVIGVTQNPVDPDFYVGDLRDSSFVQDLLSKEKIDYIIHCAARWNGRNTDMSIVYDNSLMTINLLRHIGNIKKFIYLSSSAVYDKSGNISQNSYSVSKCFCENLVTLGSSEYGYKYTIWRPYHIVSPEERYCPPSSHICTNIAHKLIKLNEFIDLNGFSKTDKIPLTWVGDVAECIVGSIGEKMSDNQAFNIGCSDLRTPYDIVQEIIVLAIEMNLVPSNKYDIKREKNHHFHLDHRFSKIKRYLDWEAKTRFYECIRKFMEYKYGKSK